MFFESLCTCAATETAVCDLNDGLGMMMWFTVFFAATETAICDLKDGLGMLMWFTVFFAATETAICDF